MSGSRSDQRHVVHNRSVDQVGPVGGWGACVSSDNERTSRHVDIGTVRILHSGLEDLVGLI